MLKKLTEPGVLKILLGIIIALKFMISFNTGLFEDEAIYWNWSQNPDPSYSFTTLSALNLFTAFPGYVNEFTVRLPALLTNFVILFFLLRTGKFLGFSERKILLTAVLIFSIPFVTIYSSFISPDSMILMFTLSSVFFSIKVIKKGNTEDWILCGVSFGLLILSKYTGVVFAAAFAVFVIYFRKDLKGFSVFKLSAFLISVFILVSPLLYWNLINEPVWLNYYFKTGADKIDSGYAESIYRFILSQTAILLPVTFILIIYITFNRLRKKEKTPEEKFLLFSGIFILFCFALLSLSGKLKGNWPFMAYIPLAFLYIYTKKTVTVRILFAITFAVNIFLLSLLNMSSDSISSIADNKFGNYINSTYHDYWPGYAGNSANDKNWEERILKMKNWQSSILKLNDEIITSDLRYDFLASDNFILSPLLKFYMKKDNVYLLGDLRFRYINSAEVNSELTGKDAILISYNDSDTGPVENRFEEIKEVKKIRFRISEDLYQEFTINQCRNFKPGIVSADE
ncbi:MAG: glycosyltransferase family 39 protein [Bacteroidetes bacterium]|nr:glycosyltransferase family 39 protein [Bacteroidota bacterium]